MKTKIFLAMGLMASLHSWGQTYSAPSTAPAAGAGGNDNVHLGHGAGAANTGNLNVFVGKDSGNANDVGISNVFIGYESGFNNTGGDANTYVGTMSGKNNNGTENVMVGFTAGINVSTDFNTFLGSAAGNSADGERNVFVGHQAGELSGGSRNTFLGNNSGNSSTGDSNVIVGYEAGLTASSSNIYIGYETAESTTGDKNVFMGYRSGKSTTTGSGNVFLGYEAGKYVTTDSNKLYVANSDTSNPLIYGQFPDLVNPSNFTHLKFNAAKVGIGDPFTTDDFTTDLANDNIYRLYVKGGILAEEVRIREFADWADYVFAPDYKLLSLTEVERYIAENGHLPNMPSAVEVKEQGIEMGNIINLQQEKIEELTLHLIHQEKEIEALKAQNKQLEELKLQVEILLKKQ